LADDPPASAQDVAGDRQFMGRCANIPRGVVQDEVFEVDEFAIDPQRGAGIGEVLPLEEAASDRRARNPLIETGEGNAGVKSRPHQV
jgi:hypothetical protein